MICASVDGFISASRLMTVARRAVYELVRAGDVSDFQAQTSRPPKHHWIKCQLGE
jgi:hypothetical protein